MRADYYCRNFLGLDLVENFAEEWNWWKQVSHRVPRTEKGIPSYGFAVLKPRHVTKKLMVLSAGECIQGWNNAEMNDNGPENLWIEPNLPSLHLVSSQKVGAGVFVC